MARHAPVVLPIAVAVLLAGCGKADIAIVKPPRVPIFVCANRESDKRPGCEDRFNAGLLLGLTLEAGDRLARRHGYTVRRIVPAEVDIGDYEPERIDVECTSSAPDCVIVRLVHMG